MSYRVRPPEEGLRLPRFPAAPADGTQWKTSTEFCRITRRLSDARVRDAIWADARAEDERHTEAVDVSTKAIDDDEIRQRYDDNDEGGTRGGRE